ncbi:HD domain-containing phosphohydrolase [Thauera propionica]|uniref:HD domain-containing phosphohydrolase n=1 Tax=Thauera propionica TaxID=2019431 RepID=UPI0023F4DEB1|nr:HD domain-containing phosphohydrolase [Thauera propionica]MDD3674337.1 response regulator [Thauera propionica]
MSALLQSAATRGDDAPPWRVLCVDDEANILSALRRLFRPCGYAVTVAGSGREGLAALEAEPFDLVISDMRMPEMNGAQFLEAVHHRWPDTMRILLTGYADIDSTIAAVNKGQIFRYVSKPWDDNDLLLVVRHALERKQLERDKARLEALTAQQNEELRDINASLELKVMERTVELRKANERIKASFITSIKVFTNLIELREGAIAGHSRRVAELARSVARRAGMNEAAVQDVFLAGLLHDIGKIGLPDALLSRSVTDMTGADTVRFRRHPVAGEQALMALEELREAARLVRAHHERHDGKGYPDGLAGEQIPLGARILAIANDYDGLQVGIVAPRKLSPAEARKLIVDSRGKRYDPAVLDLFIEVLDQHQMEANDEQAVSVGRLSPGMVLSRDLVTRQGYLLLATDFVLTAGVIRQIQEYANQEGTENLMIHVRNERRTA